MAHSHGKHAHTGHAHDDRAHGGGETVKDPVCGMEVVPRQAGGGSTEHGGTTYWFCSPDCREKFVADPARYVETRPVAPLGPPAAKPAPDTRIYTCPMHPEVRQVGPGSCPKCGMALEPVEAGTAEEGPNPELVDMTRRFWVSLVLTVPVFGVATGEMATPELAATLSPTTRLWTQLALSAPVVLWGGWPFFVRGSLSVAAGRSRSARGTRT